MINDIIIMSKKLKILMAAGAIGFSFASLESASADTSEKCYCIARMGQNDCANRLHDCATKAVKDFDCNDWKYVASGSCVDIGGSVTEGKEPLRQ